MSSPIHDLINQLHDEPTASLRARYADLFGEPTTTRNRQFLIKRIAWRTQALQHGGLSERAKNRALTLARDEDLRTTIPRSRVGTTSDASGGFTVTAAAPKPDAGSRLPIPGTVLTREYRGVKIQVRVLPKGFEHGGKVYKSLSAVAKAVTGSHWNGFHFFGLDSKATR